MTFAALVALAYVLGSIPTGLLVARLLGGPDPRTQGSGNVGTANLYRLLGRRAGLLTLLGDLVKGALPAMGARLWLAPLGAWQETAVAGVGLAAVLGHLFPLFLKFRGGKGVATSFGVVAVICPLAAVNLAVVYIAALFHLRIFSAAALLCAWLLPVAVGLFSDSKAYVLLAGVLSGLMLVRHRDNLLRLAAGKEPRLDSF
jgi:glycerol-3-phosphate acyltransferase PlsY